MNGLALCAGVGGLELGLHLALGNRYRCRAYVERDAFAAAMLVARMADEILDPAPVWDDLTTFDGRPWRGTVDLISAGFPCQPWSTAGKQAGTDDHRWLWPEIARILREAGPVYVFLENVPGLARGGLELVLGDLAEMGFDAEWDLFSAEQVGASHRRDRLFILAHARSPRPAPTDNKVCPGRNPTLDGGSDLAHTDVERWDAGQHEAYPGQPDPVRRQRRMPGTIAAPASNGATRHR